MKVLGIDIGGSAVKGAPVETRTGRLLAERHRIATPELLTPEEMADTLAQLADHFKWRGPAGVGFPGVVRGPRIYTASNLHQDFCGCDAVKLFGRATGCPVRVINDADAAGLAEMRFGAGSKAPGEVLLLTLGTGVGSALFHGGQLYPNTELGQLRWRGRRAERYVSAAARKRRGLSWKQWADELDEYLRQLETVLWPELIIIGGGISAKSGKFFKYLHPQAKLVPAKLHNEAGIVGAALWAGGMK